MPKIQKGSIGGCLFNIFFYNIKEIQNGFIWWLLLPLGRCPCAEARDPILERLMEAEKALAAATPAK